jgi:hypothetical protein
VTSTSFKFAAAVIGFLVCLTTLGCQNSKIQQEKEWKALTDTIADCSQKIANISRVMQQSGTTTEATQQAMLHDIDSIERRMKQAIRNCMERNKDNDLGKYIRENYQEE